MPATNPTPDPTPIIAAYGRKVRGGSWEPVHFKERPVRLYKSIYVANDEDAKRVDELLHNAMQVVTSLDMEQDWDKVEEDDPPAVEEPLEGYLPDHAAQDQLLNDFLHKDSPS
jgi:hypothetical protein